MRAGPLVALSLLAACRSPALGPAADPAPADPVVADDLANPLDPTLPLLPWPSDQHLVETDAATGGAGRPLHTGRVVSVPEDGLPGTMTAGMFAGDDGFSRVSALLTSLPGGVDPASLPPESDPAATLDAATAPVLVVRLDDHALWPILVETDLTAGDPAEALLILRPHRPFDPDTRYAVLVGDRVRAAGGGEAAAWPGFAAVRDGGDPAGDRAVTYWQQQWPAVSAAAEAHGWDPSSLVQAWTFRTRSDANVTAAALHMQAEVAAAPLGDWELEPEADWEVEEDRVVIEGSFTVPDFLDADGRVRFGPDGVPVAEGLREAPLLLTIPRVIDRPRPVILFGHGFFSDIDEPTWGNLFGGLERWEMSAATTRFEGFAGDGGAITFGAIIANDLPSLDTVMGQQLQSHLAFSMLDRILEDGALAEAVQIEGAEGPLAPLDPARVPYMGISNGGTQGFVMMATSPVLDRGALIVPGGGWTHMLQRAASWNTYLPLIASGLGGSDAELQLGMAMAQQVLDPADSLNYLAHLVDDRHPGLPPDPELLVVEAIADASVANLVTRWCVAEAGVPMTTPSPAQPWGIDALDEGAEVSVGYTIYDLGVPPHPAGNVPPEDNDVHDDVRRLDSYKRQVGAFLEGGVVTHPCEGPCDPD